jgi:hypothetical protein
MSLRVASYRAKDVMKTLVDKFPSGFEEWDRGQMSSRHDM